MKNNNLEPLFDEILYVPVHSVKDYIRVEVMDYQHLTKDRSLGIFELEANNLIKVTKVDELTSYHSTGKRHYSEYLKQEGKQTVVKGRIDFDVEFYPCLQMKFQPFDTCESDAEKLKTDNTSEIASTVEAVFEDNVSVLNPTESNDLVRPSDRSVLNSKPNDDYSESIVEQSSINLDNIKQSNTPKKRGPSSLTLTKEELMNHQLGVLVFNIMGGQIAKKNTRLELLFDNGYWPSYSTEPSKSTNAKWDETAECFIRELGWSRCVLKLNVAEKDTREEVYAEYTSGLKPFLDDCLEGPHEFVLEDLEGGHRSTVSIQCRYIPIPITLEPRESINNMGILTVMLDHGKDLLAADRNGYSDPYAQFVLNGLKVFKSGIQKKTLNPKWMERFEVEVPSRVHAEFFVHVFDWDRVGASDKLGQAKIDLTSLEPLQQTTIVAKLSLGDKEHGQIQMRLTFRPNFISRSREATSTFTGGFGRVATGLSGSVLSTGAGVGIGAAKGVGTLGGGVLKGVGGVGKLGYSGIKRVTGGNKRESIIGEDLENVAMEEAPSALDSKMGTISTVGSREPLASSPSKTTTKSITDFKLNIMIIGASELESSEMKTYVHVKRNEKPVYDTKTIRHTSSPEWNEAIVLDVNTGSETELSFVVYDKKKLGKDREIGMVKLNVWEVLKSEDGQRQAELNEPFIEGIGTLKIKLALTDFDSSGKSFKEVSPKRNVSGGSPLGLLSSLTGGSHHHLPLALPTSSAQKPISTIVQPQASFLDQDPNELAGGTINQKPNNRPGGGRFSFHRNR
ncbi:hypothetical protein O181_097377 [Austropuccinia psidii MF-1]|uniref:C2 domain-containing protein n=1 Tax=Austropuccinia psidii MF-1 TaxID=1389203 RepID=A0A9Q3PEG7_9BASI|nr:hypothetical protein [Austropuccinia psidii MF-1]